MKSVILDVDTGNDDAVAIMMAALHPEITLLGCTTVAGNLPVENTTENTLRVLSHIGREDVPVFRGLAKPFAPYPFGLSQGYDPSASVHQEHLELPRSRRPAEPTPAVEWLIETLRATTEPVTLVPLAPLTNIAAALTLAPDIASAVEQIVIMGGSATQGNMTSQAEFNIYLDPVAARVVMHAGFENLVLVTLDATRMARVSSDECAELGALGTPAATATAAILEAYIRGDGPTATHAAVHDALCIAYLIDPGILTLARAHVDVDTVGFNTYGRTLIDSDGLGGIEPNALVSTAADSDRFYELLTATVSA